MVQVPDSAQHASRCVGAAHAEAIQQWDHVMLRALCQLPAARQVIDGNILLQLMDCAVLAADAEPVDDDNPDCDDDGDDSSMIMLQYLIELPGTSHLSGSQLAGVLSTIIEKGLHLVLQLSELPAVKSMPVAKVAHMLRTAVHHNNRRSVELLCKLPVSIRLSRRFVEQSLLVAVDLEDKYRHWHEPPPGIFTLLCTLPGASEITDVCVLLDKAFQRANADHVLELCQLPAIRKLAADALGCYLDKAVRLGDATAVSTLCRLPNAHYIQHQVVTQLMQTAVHTGKVSVMPGLCRLRAAHHISPETLLELLQGTAERGCSRRVVLPLVKLVRRVFAFRKYFSKSSESS